ncbi:ribonuclease-domain-containing protein [Cylindrobasidium torrendii FP15055 ss-10]|uniref:Ribonuclease-domain-containing protein n=1 Tax=Cylindrobasidium torrendii FP15055 ss-10 TaxID=1314674 RepID=A0A0D7BII7_9AGAR|nr:ribonuclease-domain-containing protein [Cylindrobasidium torrendii FP15055 ss-10]
MVQLFAFVASALFATLAVASPLDPRAWPSGSVTCGSNVYTLAQVKSATAAGYAQVGNPIGSNSYPHKFNNYEGLSMWCSGESSYQEWPILKSGTYSGGSPGADRVIFSSNGVYCAVVTHTGASGNNFVSCSGD